MPSIYSEVLIKAAKLRAHVPEEKTAFVDAGMATGAGAPPQGGDPSQGGAPPPGAGGAPPDPSAGGPTMAGGAPDPVSSKLDAVLQQLQAQQAMPAAGGAKPGGGGKKGGGEMQYNIILKLLARMCDAMGVPVSLEELLTQEQQVAAMQAQAGAGAAPPAAAAAPPAMGPHGGSDVMGDIQPPTPVAPLTSVTSGMQPPAGGGGKTADYSGISVSPETLRNVQKAGKKEAAKKRPPDVFSLLRGRK